VDEMSTETLTQLTAGVWTTDPSCSTVGFSIRHLRVATVRGAFPDVSARVDVRGDGLHVEGAIATATVRSGDDIRDRRLRGELFRSAEHPAMTFTADVDALADAGETPIAGQLTICGATRPVRLGVTAEDAGGGAVRLRATGDLRRSDFGLEWDALGFAGSRLVADRVHVFADVVVVPD
jgi:polyisoprenoid-binding protein YceI